MIIIMFDITQRASIKGAEGGGGEGIIFLIMVIGLSGAQFSM